MKMTRTLAGLMLASVAVLAAFAAGALDPLMHFLGVAPDSPLALLMLANAPGAITTKSIAERIGEFTAKRAELVDKKNALVEKAIVVEGRTFDDAEAEQNAAFEADIKTIDTTLAQLKSHEAIIVAKATPERSSGLSSPVTRRVRTPFGRCVQNALSSCATKSRA